MRKQEERQAVHHVALEYTSLLKWLLQSGELLPLPQATGLGVGLNIINVCSLCAWPQVVDKSRYAAGDNSLEREIQVLCKVCDVCGINASHPGGSAAACSPAVQAAASCICPDALSLPAHGMLQQARAAAAIAVACVWVTAAGASTQL